MNRVDNSDYVNLGGAWAAVSGILSVTLAANQAITGAWNRLTNLAELVNTCGATVAGGVITLTRPGRVIVTARFRHDGSASSIMSAAVTKNSTIEPAVTSTIIDGSATSSAFAESNTLAVVANDALRMWMAATGVSATPQCILSIIYIR